MARRLFNDHAFSEDGWPYVDEQSCRWVQIAADARIQIQDGIPAIVMGAFARDYDAYIEPIFDPDSACWTPGNKVETSNHPGGTAMDLRWDSHHFNDRGTFTTAQLKTIQELLDWYEGMIFWAGVDWSEGGWGSPIDEMHWQMGYGTYDTDNDRPNPKCQDFINRKIRQDGYSKFRRGDAPPAPPPPPPVNNAAEILTRAMGGRLSITRYAELLPAVSDSLKACDCNNVNRIGMWVAQIGHESGGLFYTEEIASGADYEGRTDLGNTQPGDGVRFKGRSWIQITGRNNYTKLSQWAHAKGLVPSPTFFVDNPAELASDQYAGLGAAWYWVVARPDINALSDQRDLETVTRRINGGLNGLDDRRARYDRALGMGDQLLALTTTTSTPPAGDDDFMSALSDSEQREVIDLLRWLAAPGTGELRKLFPSRSPLRHLGEGLVDTMAGMLLNTDSSQHVEIVKLLASLGHPESLALLREVASADPVRYPDRQADKLIAQAILADLNQPHTQAPAPPAPVFTPPVVYESPPPATNGKAKSTGDTIGNLYTALEEMHLADALPIEARAPLAALIAVLQTKNGANI